MDVDALGGSGVFAMWRTGIGHVVAVVAALGAVSASVVAPRVSLAGGVAGVVTEFSAGITADSGPSGIAAGPDGNLWFTEARDRIGRITPDGVVTEFAAGITAGSRPTGIAAGPDGNLWFTEFSGHRVGRITPAGAVTEFSTGITPSSFPSGITAGPDGNLWFTETAWNKIGRLNPTTGEVTEFPVTAASQPEGIAAGPDGNLWFTESNGNRIGRITPAGVVTEFSAGITTGSYPFDIAAGPDGSLWFTERVGNRIGRITPAGVVMEFSAGIPADSSPYGIAAGPDGDLWFTESIGNRIGRITTAGVVTEFSAGITAGSSPYEIAAGPDGDLWFSEYRGSRLGRITSSVDPAVSAPVLAGTGQVGLPLLCGNATWALNPRTVTMAWTRNATTIPGQTGPGYTPTEADLGMAIACTQTATLPAVLTPVTAVSTALTVIPLVIGSTGATGPAGPAGPAGATGPVGPAGEAPLVAVFAPRRLKARAGARLTVVYAVSRAAVVTLRLARRKTTLDTTASARAGTNTTVVRLKKAGKPLPRGTYALTLAGPTGTTLTTATVTITR